MTTAAPCSIGRREVRRREGVVDEQRDADLAAGRGQRVEVRHVEPRVADGLDEPRRGGVVARGDESGDVGRLDEAHRDAEPPERVQEDVPGAAVERRRGDDAVAGAGDVEQAEHLGGVARGDGERRAAAVQTGDALLEHVVGGIHDARVDVAERAQAEEVGGVVGVLEVVGDRLVDRDGARAGGGIRSGAAVDGDGVETRGGRVAHGDQASLLCSCLMGTIPDLALVAQVGRRPPGSGAYAERPGLGHHHVHHRHELRRANHDSSITPPSS